MISSRSSMARGLAGARLARPLRSSAVRRNLQPVLQRGYASGGGHAAPSSDLPWLLGAIAVTIPTTYFLWPSQAHGDAGHGHGHATESHEESHEESKDEPEEEPQEESKPEESGADDSKDEESKEDDSKDEKPKDDESKDEGKDAKDDDDSKSDGDKKSGDDKSDDSKDEKKDSTEPEKTSNKKVDGVQFKGKTSAGDDNNEMQDTRKREPDSKGAYKKRIDSAYQKNLGEGEHKTEDGSHSGKTAVEPSGHPGAIDTKQAGISTTPTRHSTAIDKDPEKSKKGEGVPDTAKSQTTIDPKRPAK